MTHSGFVSTFRVPFLVRHGLQPSEFPLLTRREVRTLADLLRGETHG